MSSIVLLSGGLDSTTLAAVMVHLEGATNVDALSVDYGQRHRCELSAAARIADALGIRHDVVDLRGVGSLLASALTTDIDVPHGHYSAETMSATVVPNRNAIMLMVATGVAASRGRSSVVTAVHAGDHPIYPDCRPEFVDAASMAASWGTAGMGDVVILAPFVDKTKADIVALGAGVGAPLDLTWSCYQGGGDVHCGRCGTCVERAEAFALAGVTDPTVYADAAFWKTATATA